MRAWQVGSQQGIESLALVERPDPSPGPGQVRIAVVASALNHRDLMIANARYGKPKPPNRVPLGDGAGVVEAVGAGVTQIGIGDRVTAPHFTSWIDGAYQPSVFEGDAGNTIDGWLAERVLMPATALVRLPEGLDFADAAALGAAGITAWTVIETLGGIKPGDLVLALGTGGVSILALQIARMAGARFAITSSSDEKLRRARELGADFAINYRSQPEWQAALLEATGGRGVDIVVETGGFATLPRSLACCAPNARIGLLGALGGKPDGPMDLSPLIRCNAIIKGITSGSRRMLEDLLLAFATNRVKPVIDRTFTFGDAVAAYRYLERGEQLGKVIIRHDQRA